MDKNPSKSRSDELVVSRVRPTGVPGLGRDGQGDESRSDDVVIPDKAIAPRLSNGADHPPGTPCGHARLTTTPSLRDYDIAHGRRLEGLAVKNIC